MDQLTNTERLLLAQAVYQEGANDWSKVSQIISNHPLIGRPKSYFNPSICSSIYTSMIHAAGLDGMVKDNAKPRADVNRKLAEVHYATRVTELRDLIFQEETRFKTVLTEIEEIRSGLWDERIKASLGIVSPEPTHDVPAAQDVPEVTEVEEPTNEIEDVSMPDVEPLPQQDEQSVDEPTVDEPIVDELIVDEPIVDEPIVDEPIVDEPIVNEPTVDEPIVIDDSDATTDEPLVAQQVSQELEEEEVDLHLTPNSVPSSPKHTEGVDTAQEQTANTNEEPAQPDQKEAEPQSPFTEQDPGDQEDAGDLDVTEPDITEPDITEPDITEPDIAEPDIAEPDIAKADIEESGIVEPDIAKADIEEPDIEEPGIAEPDHVPSPPAPLEETAADDEPEQEDAQEVVASEKDEPDTGVQTRRGKRKADTEADPKREKKKSREISEVPEESEPEPVPAKKRRGTTSEAASRIFQNVISLLHDQICELRNGSIFHGPVKVSDAPDYYELVKRPTDLKAIKARIRDGHITNSLEYQRDIYLMFANSMMYNRPDSDLYKMAEEMMLESEQLINQFRQTEGWNP